MDLVILELHHAAMRRQARGAQVIDEAQQVIAAVVRLEWFSKSITCTSGYYACPYPSPR